jgi:hypothetical protein
LGSANGDRSASRRKKRLGSEALTPTGAGEMLREARERLGIDLAEVHDRTGISWRNLEALESGDLQRFADLTSAAVAMRRYADLVSIDSAPLVKSLEAPVHAYAGGSAAPSKSLRGGSAGTTQEAEPSGHLRRYEGDPADLRSFTQTAQVPAVSGGGQPGGLYPGNAGARYRHSRRRKAPLGLRLLTWLVLFLLIVGGAGLGVDNYKPQWLRDIHILKSAPRSAAPANSQKHHVTTRRTTPTTLVPPVTTAQMGVGTATVKVSVANYTVVVTASNRCWVYASVPMSAKALFNETVVAGQTVSIPVTGGQLNLELGSVAATITIKIGGKIIALWQLRPDSVPFTTTFTNT